MLECIGGFGNVTGNSLCATRLRISLKDRNEINRNALHSINGVLGVVDRGTNGIEVVFGPNLVRGVFQALERLTGLRDNDHDEVAAPVRPAANFQVSITPETPGAPLVTGTVTRATNASQIPSDPTSQEMDQTTSALLEMLESADAS